MLVAEIHVDVNVTIAGWGFAESTLQCTTVGTMVGEGGRVRAGGQETQEWMSLGLGFKKCRS